MVFIKHFEQWHDYWAHCMKSQADYFEMNKWLERRVVATEKQSQPSNYHTMYLATVEN